MGRLWKGKAALGRLGVGNLKMVEWGVGTHLNGRVWCEENAWILAWGH